MDFKRFEHHLIMQDLIFLNKKINQNQYIFPSFP